MIRMWAVLMLLTVVAFANDKVDTDGHNPGRFTMDFDAAKAYAAEKDMPVLLNFTGSDWCGWCKIMDKNVFNQSDWADYAKGNLVMVWVDFPKNKSLVPQKYVARNNELRTKYGVRGYPTYILVDAKADKVIGRLGAGRDKTPASFKAEVEAVASMTESRVKAFAKNLNGGKGDEYLKMYEEIKQREAALSKAKEQYNKLVKESNDKIAELKSTMEETRVTSRLKEDEVEGYLKLRGELKQAKKDLQSFISSAPENNPANMQKFQSLSGKVKEIEGKLSKY